MKVPRLFLRCKLSELVARARQAAPAAASLASLLLASACQPGPRHPASPGPRHHVGEWYESDRASE